VITHPRTEELVESVIGWIEQIRPQLDPRNGFLSRVAANALGAVGRELTLGPAAEARAGRLLADLLAHDGPLEELNAELCARIRAGELDSDTPGLLAALHAMAMDQLAIDQPSYKHEGLKPPPARG
jgi:hypothetical protein